MKNMHERTETSVKYQMVLTKTSGTTQQPTRLDMKQAKNPQTQKGLDYRITLCGGGALHRNNRIDRINL